jgi:5-(carboxyamino)imidazole ribonucleotide mutase
MPAGVPVATMAIGKAGARNAAVLATQMLALNDSELQEQLRRYKLELADQVDMKAEELRQELESHDHRT